MQIEMMAIDDLIPYEKNPRKNYHAKIYAGCGSKFSFGIESSANINTNPRTENTTITVDPGVFFFYKDFFDGIKSYNRDYDNWQPWSMPK